MTSINDGKDVKSNQASGQKGKTYYIELYKSLDTQLNAECSLHARVTLLCNAWRRVHTLCQHSVPTTHPFLLAWIQRHTARTVLQTEWQSPTSKDEHARLGEALDAFLQECRDGASLPWESQLRSRAEWFKGMLHNPWDHPVLKVLLDPKGEGPTTDDILKWLLEERGVVFCVRLRQLALSKCDDLALALLTAVMDRVRTSRPPVNDCDIKEEAQPQSEESTFESILNKEAGFAESWDLLTDMEFVLLHKSQGNTRLIDLAKQTPLGNGYQLVERLINRLETNPKEKKIWKNAKDVATLIAQVMITRCMVIPQCQGTVRTVLYWCSRALVKVLPPAKLGKTTLVLAAPAGTARHLHTLATAVHAQQSAGSEEIKPFVVELYVRAITFGMNELEKLKLRPEYEEKEARATEQTLASWFIQFGQLLKGSERMRCECMLTAFSVHPSPKLFERIKNAPTLKPVTLDASPKKDEPGTTDNSWANDSRSMTNFVKTSETLNLKQTQNSANVMSTAIVNEGEALGLDAELCTDIIVLLSGPRVKTLSWDMDRETLLANCRAYMERTQGGTRALTTELKYLNIDPAEYQHLPEEDDNEDDLYYGIEKGYEHLVEIEPQPEEIWEDAVEADNVDTAGSSSSEGDSMIKRKKKSKPFISSSESDTDPLSLAADKKDRGEKKERPHSKERSNSSSKKSDGKHRNSSASKKDKKERKKEKKERKKKEKIEKAKPANSLSHLVGVKVTQVTTEEARGLVTDSDYDSQGKSSLQSEGNDENVVYDGQFSMDEQSPHKNSPEFHINLSKELDAASGHINNALSSPSTGKSSPSVTQTKTTASHTETSNDKNKISSELKKSINRLIQFRKQKKPTQPTSEASSRPTSSLSSLIGTKLQNTSNLILTKTQTDHLASMKNEVKGFTKAIYYPPKAKNNCSRTQPFNSPRAKQKPTSTQPPVDMSNLPQDPTVLDNAMNQYTQMQGQKPQTQPAQPSSQTSHLTIYQQFLQELQKNSAAGLPITKEHKAEVKPNSRVPEAKTDSAATSTSTLASPTSKPESVIQCAKPTPPKKVESMPSNVPNTFARLSYMKSKLNEKPKPEPNPALQYSVSEELDRRIAELRFSKMAALEKELSCAKMAPKREPPKVEVQSIEQPYVNTPSLPKEHPVLTNILKNNFGTVIKCSNTESQKLQTEARTYANKPKESSLTEKDQQDISKLLGQKSIMDSYNTQPNVSPQGSAVINTQVLNNTLSQTGHTDPTNKNHPKLSKSGKVSQPLPSTKIQQDQAQNNNEIIEIRARLPVNVAGTDFKFPVISNTTILRTTAMIQDSKVCIAQSTQPKAKAKRKTSQKIIPTHPANVLEVNKAVSKKYVPKPPISTPKFDVGSKEQDWTQVMDALRSQKTPVRGPDALDLAMNMSGYENADANVPVKSALDIKIENIIAGIMKQQALEQGKSTPNVLRETPMQSTGAVPKAIHKQPKYPDIHKKVDTKIVNVSKPVAIYPIEEPRKHLQPELIKEDPFISGNTNADYDILEGLLDDDLRKEIGELLSEEDDYSASNISVTENKHDLVKSKHLMKSNVQAQPQLATKQGFIDSNKAAQRNKQIPAAVPPAAPQKEKLRIISNEKVDIRDLADNILPIIRKTPTTVINKPQDVAIQQNLKSGNQTGSHTKSTTVLKPTNVVYSETVPNMVIYDPFGVSKSNQNFVTVDNTSKLVYQPYQIIQSALIIPPVNVTFSTLPTTVSVVPTTVSIVPTTVSVVPTTVSVQVPTTVPVQKPQVQVNQRVPIPTEIRNLPVSKANKNIIISANDQPNQDCAVSKTNTTNNIEINKTQSFKLQSKGPEVVVKANDTKKEQVPAKDKQKDSRKPKVIPTDNVTPSISSDQVAAKQSPIKTDNPTEKVNPEPLSERDSVKPCEVTDDNRIHKKRQAIINRQIHYHLYYPPIPLGYASLTTDNHRFDKHEPRYSEISEHKSTIVKKSVENTDGKEDSIICRRILLRSSNTISGVAKQNDNLGRKAKVRLKDPDRNKTQTNEILAMETKPVSESISTESTDTFKDDNTAVSKVEGHGDVKTKSKNVTSTGSTHISAPSRSSKRILNKKIKKIEENEAKTQRDISVKGDLKRNKNVKKIQHKTNVTKLIDPAIPDEEDTTLDVEANLPGVKIIKTKVHPENTMKVDEKLVASEENTVDECRKFEQAGKNKNKKPLADISAVNKEIPLPKEMVNPNIDTIEILSSPEIMFSDENPMIKASKLCDNKDTFPTHLNNAIDNTVDENLELIPLEVNKAECIPALGETKSVDGVLNSKSEIDSAHGQSAIDSPVATDTTVSDDAFTKSCDVDSSKADSEKIETKQVSVKSLGGDVLSRDEVISVVTPIGQKLSTNKPLISGTVLTRDEIISVITPIGQKLSTESKLTRLVDDIESALSAITETVVSSPIIETPIDKELDATSAQQVHDEDTSEKFKTNLESVENFKENETMHSSETVQCGKILDPKNPDENPAEVPQAKVTNEEISQNNTNNASDGDATVASNSITNKEIKRTSPEATFVGKAQIIEKENTIATCEDDSKLLETESPPATVLTQSVRQETYSENIKSTDQGNQTTNKASVLDKNVEMNVEKVVNEIIALSDDSEVDSSTETDNTDKSADPNRFTPKDIPQSYKDSIQIVEIPIPGNTNPFKRCVKIKLPNNRMFKATVHGKMSVSFDSLFEEPVLKNILLSDLNNKKKYTLSVSVPPNKNDIQPKTVDTVNLISDDEDEPELPVLKLKTSSGSYKIRHVDNDTFKKHQEIFTKKCFIKLQRCDEKCKTETKKGYLVEALLKDLVPSLDVEPSEVIEIPDSDSENELPQIDTLKNMLLKDLGVVDNLQSDKRLEINLPMNANNLQLDKNLEINLPENAILVENKRLSRSRKSIYHRDREPVTLIIPEKRSSSQTKRSKSANSNKSQNSNDEEHRPDYSHIIKRKYCVELERCDNMVKKLKNQSKVGEQDCLSDTASSDDDTSRALSRSGSFSLLNELEVLNVPVAEEIASSSEVHHDVNPNRTSPVMKIYDIIAALNKISTTCTTLDLDASKCTSDWFHTKRDMHSEKEEVEYVSDSEEDVSDKNDIPTDCETDATEFEALEDNEIPDVSTANTNISLQSIMAKYFENNPIVNIIKPLRGVFEDDVPKTPIKRKSAAQHKHICKVTKTSAQTYGKMETQIITEDNYSAVIDGTQTEVNGSETDGKFEENLTLNETIQNITQTSIFQEEATQINRASQDGTILSEGREVSDNDPIKINMTQTLDDLPFSPSLVVNIPELIYCEKSDSDKTSSNLDRVEVFTSSTSKETITVQEKEIGIPKDKSIDLISNERMDNEYSNTLLPQESENSTTQEQVHAQSLSSVSIEITEFSNHPVEMDMSDISSHKVEIRKDRLTTELVESLKLKVLKVINEKFLMSRLVPVIAECATEYETTCYLLEPADFTTYTTESEIPVPDLVEEPKTCSETKNTLEKLVEAVASDSKPSLELSEPKPSTTGQETPDLPELAGFSPSTLEWVEELIPEGSHCILDSPRTSSKVNELDKSYEIIDVEKSPNILDPTNDQPLSVVELPELLITAPIESICKTSSNALIKERLDSTFSEIVCSNVPDVSDMMSPLEPEKLTGTELNQTDKSMKTLLNLTNSVQSPKPSSVQSEIDTVITEIVQCSSESCIAIGDNSILDDVTVSDFESKTERMGVESDKFLEDTAKDQESIARECIAAVSNNLPENTEIKQETVNKSDPVNETMYLDTESNLFLDNRTINNKTTATEIKPCTVTGNHTLQAEVEENSIRILGPVNEDESMDMESDKQLEEGNKNVAPELDITLLSYHTSRERQLHEKTLTDDSIVKTEIDNGSEFEIDTGLQDIVKHEEASENILPISSANKLTAIEKQPVELTLIEDLVNEAEIVRETSNTISENDSKDNVEFHETLGNELEITAPKNETKVESTPENTLIESEEDHTLITNQTDENTGLNDNLIHKTDMIHVPGDIESQKCLELEANNEEPPENAFIIASPHKTTPIEIRSDQITLTDNLIEVTELVSHLNKTLTKSADINEDILQTIPGISLMDEEIINEMTPVELPLQVCSKIVKAVEQSLEENKKENVTIANIETKPDTVHNMSEGTESKIIENNYFEKDTAIHERTIQNQSPIDKQPEFPTGVTIMERFAAEDNVKHKDLSIEVDNNFYKKPDIEDDVRSPVNSTASVKVNTENISKYSMDIYDRVTENKCVTLAIAEASPSRKQQTFELEEILEGKPQVSILPSTVSNAAHSSCIEDITESNEKIDRICPETFIGNDLSDKSSEAYIPLNDSFVTAAKNNVSDLNDPVSNVIPTYVCDNNNIKSVPSEINIQEVMDNQSLSLQSSSQEIDPENLQCETEVITDEILNDSSKVPSEINIQQVVPPSFQRSSQEIDSENLESKTEVITEEILNDSSKVPSGQEVLHRQSPSLQLSFQKMVPDNLECKTEVTTESLNDSYLPSEMNIQQVVSPSHQHSSQGADAENLECKTEVITQDILIDSSELPSEQEEVYNQSPSLQRSSHEIDPIKLECETEMITEEILNDSTEVPSEMNIQQVLSPSLRRSSQEINPDNLESKTEQILNESYKVPSEQEVLYKNSSSLQLSPQEIVPDNLECETEVITESLNDSSEVPSEMNIQQVVSPSLQRSSQGADAENLESKTEVITEMLSDSSESPSEQEEVYNQSPSLLSLRLRSSHEIDPIKRECETEMITEEILNDSSEVTSEMNIQQVVSPSLRSSQEIDPKNLQSETEVITEEILNYSPGVPSDINIQQVVSPSLQRSSQEIDPENLESKTEVITEEILNDNTEVPSEMNIQQVLSPSLQRSSQVIDPENLQCETEVITEKILNDSSKVKSEINIQHVVSPSLQRSSQEIDPDNLESKTELITKEILNYSYKVPSEQEVLYKKSSSLQLSSQEIVPDNLECETEVITESLNDSSEVPSEMNTQQVVSPSLQRSSQGSDAENLESKTEVITEEMLSDSSELPSEQEEVHNQSPSLQRTSHEIDPENLECETEVITEEILNDSSEVPSEMNMRQVVSPSLQNSSQETDSETLESKTEIITEEILNDSSKVPSEQEVLVLHRQSPSLQSSSQEMVPDSLECETEVITEEILNDSSEVPGKMSIQQVVSPSLQRSFQGIDAENLEFKTEVITEEFLSDSSALPSEQEEVHNQSPSLHRTSHEIDPENLECETEVITEEILNDSSEVPSEMNMQQVVSLSLQHSSQETDPETLESKTEIITEEILNDSSEVPSEMNIREMAHNQSPLLQRSSQEIDAENLESKTQVITEEILNDSSEVTSEMNIQQVLSPSLRSSHEIHPENLECETEVITEEILNDSSEVPSEINIQLAVSPSLEHSSQEIDHKNLECKIEVITEILNDSSEVPIEINKQEMAHNQSPSLQHSSQEVGAETLKCMTEVITEKILSDNTEAPSEQEEVHIQSPSPQRSSQEINPEHLECETKVIAEENSNYSSEVSNGMNKPEVNNQSPSRDHFSLEVSPENLEFKTEVITEEILNDSSEVPSEINQELVHNQYLSPQQSSQEIDLEKLECETEAISNDSSEIQEVIELTSPTSTSPEGCSNIIVEKSIGEIECDENILEKNATLVYKDDSGVVLKGIEYNDPEIGPCYVFPLAKSSDVSDESELLNESGNSTIEVIHEMSSDVEMQSPERPESKTDLYDDEYLYLLQPKVTYTKRKLKRKSNMKDVLRSEKRTRRNPRTRENIQLIIANRFRKDKKIDVPKLTAAAIAKTSYIKEFEELMNHYDNIGFSYSIILGREFIDVPSLLQNWPVKGPVAEEFSKDQESQNLLFNDTQTFVDPLEKSFFEEITADYNDANYPITAEETNMNVGFGEGSGRVIQNLSGGTISKFSAATLSDVKQSQPFLLSEKSDDMVRFHQSSQQELLETLKRLSTYLELKEKVRSFFKNTTIELTRTSKKEKDSVNNEDTSSFPFHLYIPKIVEPRPLQTIIQVVQVGQLPVSAAAQNPVTCDPRVTQVSDASPSQCSVDNSPHNPQHDTRTEYTELTTADLSMPLVDEYTQHNQSLPMDSQEGTNMAENIPIQTELLKSSMKFVEITDENTEEKEKCIENSDQTDRNNRVAGDYIYDSNNTRASVEAEIQALFEPDKQETSETIPDPKPQNGSVEKTDQIAHAMNAAGISTTPETVPQPNRAQAFVNLLSQKIRQSTVVSTPNSPNSYPKTTTINAMSLQQALAQILPPPLNQTSSSDNNQQSQNTGAPQVLHIVQGKGGSGNQITLLDNTQQSVITTPNATPVLHIVQNKSATPGNTSNGSPAPQTNTFSGISLVDAGLQQGGNQLLHIVNTGNQKNNNTSQLLKRVNLLTNLTNVQGSNEQKMVQFVCKSADGKSIQLNAPHQRSMVLRLQPIEPPNIQAVTSKPAENQELSPTSNSVNTAPIPNKVETSTNQQEIKSRSVYEENYAKFIQNSSNKSTVLEKLPKFNQAFGKSVYQDGNQKQNEVNTSNLPSVNTATENSECPPAENTINLDHIGPINSPPLLLRKSPQTTQTPQPNLVQQIKQAIAPMNLQTMHGGVIYTRQIPVNIGGGQTINLITVPSTEIVDESGQKQQINQEGVEPSIIKIVPQSQPQTTSTEGTTINDENAQQNPPQPQPVLTQMRIKLPMLSKNPQMVSGARVVRPSFFQIQRNIVGGTNQQVYQQLVLTAAPPLGQQTIRLPQTQTRQIKIPENQSPSESQMSTSTLEQLREFDMVLEQVKERSTGQPNSNSNSSFKLHNPSTDTTDSPPSATSTSTAETTQVLYSIGSNQPINVAYVNRKTTVTTPTTSTFVRSPDSSGIADSPTSSSSQAPLQQADTPEYSSAGTTSQPKVKISSRQRPRPKPHLQNTVKVTPPPKPSAQKPLEDEQTTQRILYILAEYKEQVENSPDKDKPAPRRRNNPPTNPSGSSKRKKSSSGSRRSGRDLSPVHGDDMCRTMGSEDSSCGTSQGDCNESCMDSHSPQDSPQKVSRKLTFEPELCSTLPKSQPQRNVIVADGQTITVARGTTGKPATAVLMPANYILPVSMVKGGQQIAIVTNRGPKLLTVGGGEGGATNALLLQRLIGPAGLKPVLARPGVRHVRLPTAALHNLQAFNLATASTTQPPDSTASPASDQNPPDLVESNRSETSPWADRSGNKPDRASSPDETEPWNLPSSADPHDYSYEETVRAENMDRTVLDQIQDRYSPDMEAQRIFDKMFDVEKKSYTVDSVDSPRCGYDIDASDCDDKPYQVVHKKDTTARQGRFAHVSAAALRHKYAILEHELRLQKSLSEECEDLGVDSPSASELFPEAELLFAASPAQDHASDATHHSHTPQPTLINQSAIQPDIDDQIATDHLLHRPSDNTNDRQDLDVNLGLEDVGIVTVSQDGMQATIALDQEEFARSHPNTTFHSEPTEEAEVQPFTISGLKPRHVTSTIFHSNPAPATVLMSAPQPTVISQPTTDQTQHSVKYSELDNIIHTLPTTHTNNMNLPSVLVKDDGLTRFDNILTDSRELHLSNTASAIVHSSGNATQVIRRVCYDDSKRARDSFLMDEPDPIIAGDDAKMVAEDSSRDATLESMAGDVDDDTSSPGRNAELFWESNSASERSESRRPLDFSSDSDKCCKSPSYDETNSTDSSGIGAHMRLDSVIKDARGIDRSGSADGSSADDTHPPLRTYPPKRLFHTTESDAERSLSGKTRAGEGSPDTEVRRRASGRGVVKRGCHCCNGSPAPPKPKKPRQRKSTSDFTH